MSVAKLRVIVLGVGLLICSPATAQSPDPALTKSEAAAEQDRVQAWVADLNADEYAQRQRAAERLIAAGLPAVEPVAAAISGANLEVIMGGIQVLRELALSGDAETEAAARDALQQLAETEVTSAARRAKATLQVLDEMRRDRAIELLRQLGARTSGPGAEVGLMNSGVVSIPLAAPLVRSIEFGPEWRGTVQDLRNLEYISDLQHVTLTGERVTDDWIESLVKVKSLQSLHVKNAALSDKATELLKKLPRLRELVVMYVPITDRSVDSLSGLTQLADVRLYGTEISDDGGERLKLALSGSIVDFRRGGFLGVRFNQQTHSLGCVVGEVVPDSAAAQGGLKPGDLIVRYFEKRVSDYQELTQLIGQKRAGEVIELQVARVDRLVPRAALRQADMPLGLEVQPHPLGVEVVRVEPNSAAATLSLAPGNVLIAFRRQELTDADQLKRLYDAAEPGQPLEIQVIPQCEVLKKSISLGEWALPTRM